MACLAGHVLSLSCSLLPLAAAHAGTWLSNVPGSADHPMLEQFTGSALVRYKKASWREAVRPIGMEAVHQKATGRELLKDRLDVEGQVTRLVYLVPVGQTPLEVFRNHQQALAAAGFTFPITSALNFNGRM